jgi:hypothetical protein
MLPLETRGRIAAVCMWLIIFSCGASIITNIFLQDYIVEVYSTPGYEDEPLTGEDIILFLVFLTWPVAFLFSGVSFFVWSYRARANLDRAGLTGMKYKPYWTVIGFIIPILSLFRPLQVMREIWSGSKYLSRTANVESWQKVTAGRMVGFWWGLTLLTILMDRIVASFWEQTSTPGAFLGSVYLTILVDIITIITAYIAAKMIMEITHFQEQAKTPQPETSIPAGISA